MSQTLEQYIKSLESKTKAILRERSSFALGLGQTATAFITRRIQRKGEKADGSKFKTPYSRTALPGFFFPAKFTKYARINKQPPNYENYRKFLGLPIDKRNLTLSGKMLASVAPDINEERDEVIITIKSNDSEQQKKVNWNAKREDTNILASSKKEINHLRGDVREWVNKIMREN